MQTMCTNFEEERRKQKHDAGTKPNNESNNWFASISQCMCVCGLRRLINGNQIFALF